MQKFFIYAITLMSVLLVGCGNNADSNITVISDTSINNEIDKNTINNEDDTQPEISLIHVDDSELENVVNDVVSISEGQLIEKAEWIEKGIVFRVAIERSEELPGEYRHLKDYIFVKEDKIKWFVVDYASKKDSFDSNRYVGSACEFDILYEDVTFDGVKDVLISLGYFGASSKKYCAYVYSGNEFVYVKSFENIMFDHIDNNSRCIVGFESDGYGRKVGSKYEYYEGEFFLTEETIFEYDENVGGFGVKEVKEYKPIEERQNDE